jgi:hypothetical protein
VISRAADHRVGTSGSKGARERLRAKRGENRELRIATPRMRSGMGATPYTALPFALSIWALLMHSR